MANKGEQTRAQIVTHAQRLFHEHGFDGTSFSDIVEASGLYRGNIYHYFKSKDDILLAVVESRLGEFRAQLLQWEQDHSDPRDQLMAFAGMVAANGGNLSEFGCPIGSLNIELGKDRRDLQAAARALFDLFRDWLAARYAALDCADPTAAALHLLGRAQGIAVIAQVYRDEAWLQREVAQLKAWIAAM